MFDLLKILSKEDCEFLIKHVDDAEKHIKDQNEDGLLIEIEYAILREGLRKDGFYNDFGHQMQDIHDNIIDAIDEYNESHKKTP